jgi:ankyrin repeat protein
LDVEPGHWKKQLPAKYLALAKKGDLPRLAVLLQAHPEFLSKRGSHNRTLLWEAARNGKLATVTMLVDAGADVNATGCYNSETMVQITPYCAARHYGREAIATYLWVHGSTLDIFRAAFLGDRLRVEQELAAQPDLLPAEDPHDEIYYVPLLSFAVAGGHANLAEFLIHSGAPITQYSAQLLHLAAQAGRKDLVDLLLANGADPRAVGVGIFVAADLHLLHYLLSKGVSPNGQGGAGVPPLVYVARGDKGERPDKVGLLLEHGADINASGPNGKTALHYAAAAGHNSVVTLLLDRGADATLADSEEHTALDLARAAGKITSSDLLAAGGAKVGGHLSPPE